MPLPIAAKLRYIATSSVCRGSSVVERTIGNGKAESSILSRGTILQSCIFLPPKCLNGMDKVVFMHTSV